MFKLIKYDLKLGTMDNFLKLGILVIIVICIGGISINNINGVEEYMGCNASILDYVCFFVGGPKNIPNDMLDTYVIPVLWLILQVMIAYIVGYYAMTDLDTYGQQILIRAGSRLKWWLSKCLWNGVMVILTYIIIYGAAFLAGIIGGADWEFKLTPDIIASACEITWLTGESKTHMIILFMMPVIVSLTLSMLQMFFALLFSPIIGFIVSQSIVFLATIFTNKILFANYGMLSHNKLACGSDIVLSEGLVICGMIYIVSFVVGIIYFCRYDILPKTSED